MKLTIATITARLDPGYKPLITSLAAQAICDDDIELIVIDFYARPPNVLLPGLEAVPAVKRVLVHPPKPNPWQGAQRVTSRDLHGIANARNTALCLATHDYIAFLDDRVTLCPTWLEAVRKHARTRVSAVGGPCDKQAPFLKRDHRWRARPQGGEGVGGGWLYGGNFCLPLAWALEVNGCEEGTDPAGYQDVVFGMMLANKGRRIDYDTQMQVTLERNGDAHPFPRHRDQKRIKAIERRFFKCTRTDPEWTPDLMAIREIVQRGEPFPPHSTNVSRPHWYDSKPIGDM